jgi:hypothetical protein
VGISITGGYVYRGCAIPDLPGTYVFGDWSGGKIFSFRYNPPTLTELQERTATLGGGGGLTSFGTDAYGEIYYTRGAGEVRKIVPVAAQGPDCNGNGRRDACDILDHTSADTNQNDIPDTCECLPEVCDGFDNDCNGTIDDAAAPTGSPVLTVSSPGLSWSASATATGYDVVRGSLNVLRAGSGDFSAAVDQCLLDDGAATSLSVPDLPADGEGLFFIVRPVNCGGAGTYDSGAPPQAASRDAGIQASAEACP